MVYDWLHNLLISYFYLETLSFCSKYETKTGFGYCLWHLEVWNHLDLTMWLTLFILLPALNTTAVSNNFFQILSLFWVLIFLVLFLDVYTTLLNESYFWVSSFFIHLFKHKTLIRKLLIQSYWFLKQCFLVSFSLSYFISNAIYKYPALKKCFLKRRKRNFFTYYRPCIIVKAFCENCTCLFTENFKICFPTLLLLWSLSFWQVKISQEYCQGNFHTTYKLLW